MEAFNNFLESSTIHGLSYISTTRKYVRLFWILVVITGFTGAGVLIYQSFQAWEDSPVSTTIETLPIAEITLPKVTVCPPKNTFTNLNYDIMMAKNIFLDNATRNELFFDTVDMIQIHNFKDIMFNISHLEEENRFFNWYKGYTDIQLPYWGITGAKGPCSDAKCLIYQLSTKTTSGTISTLNFGEKFDVNKIETNLFYLLQVFPPLKQRKNNSITLHFEIEKDVMESFDIFSDSVENQISTLTRNITPPGSFKAFMFLRETSMDEVLREAEKSPKVALIQQGGQGGVVIELCNTKQTNLQLY